MFLIKSDKYRDMGVLLLRVGIGISFMVHGYPKIIGGLESWTKLGKAFTDLGFDLLPGFWGFMAAFSEFGGGFLLAIGLLTRPASFLMFVTMIVALLMHLKQGDTFGRYSNALKSGVIFLSFLFIGPGKYSLDEFAMNKLNIWKRAESKSNTSS
ncbi:MAG: DoxX family protein [Candidatus Marinimicrobia bacterium]|nr:DoxX family protein [Candidatus Neomarinimicrobiota bacterium]